MNGTNVETMLIRAGVIGERAKRAMRPLDKTERTITESARMMANQAGFSRIRQNVLEMEGQRNFKEIMSKTYVKARFAYYDEGFEEILPKASYFIQESNHPSLPESGNVSEEDFTNAGMDIPKHPTYAEWVKKGSPVYRGGL